MLLPMRCTAAILGSLCLATPALAGIHTPIIGGTPGTLGQYPSVVLVEVGGGLCSGTLISKDWVLTAAHCVSTQVMGGTQQSITASVKVHFNTVNANQSLGTIVTASDTIPDPMFNLNSLGAYDSGLIKLATPVTNVTPVPLNFFAAQAPVGIAVTMVGFGTTAVGGGGSVGIEYVVGQTSIACSSLGSDANLLCFSQVSGKGQCEGDSGGPSFAMIGGKQMQVGITSFGDQNCSQFGADTRTDAEMTFILQHVPELQCSTDADCPMMHECFLHKCIVTPFQPMGLGSTCTSGADCDSGMCASSGDGTMKCSTGCTVGAADTCPMGFDCLGATGGAGACWPTPVDGGGCCDASGRGAPTMLAAIAIVGIVLRRRRRA
jgi:uncharacterized protein (TIGR03382 family)